MVDSISNSLSHGARSPAAASAGPGRGHALSRARERAQGRCADDSPLGPALPRTRRAQRLMRGRNSLRARGASMGSRRQALAPTRAGPAVAPAARGAARPSSARWSVSPTTRSPARGGCRGERGRADCWFARPCAGARVLARSASGQESSLPLREGGCAASVRASGWSEPAPLCARADVRHPSPLYLGSRLR